MGVLPYTVKWKVAGQLFYRRVHRVNVIERKGDVYVAKKTAGEVIVIPATAVMLIGRKVLKTGI